MKGYIPKNLTSLTDAIWAGWRETQREGEERRWSKSSEVLILGPQASGYGCRGILAYFCILSLGLCYIHMNEYMNI